MNPSIVSKIIKVPISSISGIYPYGSRVYGTHTENSDYDYQVIVSDELNINGQQFDTHDKRFSFHVHSKSAWDQHIKDHRIFALECESYNLLSNHSANNLVTNRAALRCEISKVSSNSWVKCKKKLEVHEEHYIGLKSLFHSFRIVMFGIQLAQHGRIIDFSEANHIWFNEIIPHYHSNSSWEIIHSIFKPKINQLNTKFRILIPEK